MESLFTYNIHSLVTSKRWQHFSFLRIEKVRNYVTARRKHCVYNVDESGEMRWNIFPKGNQLHI